MTAMLDNQTTEAATVAPRIALEPNFIAVLAEEFRDGRKIPNHRRVLFPALRCLAQLPIRRLLAQLDAAGVRVGDVRQDAACECAGRRRIADHQAMLPERRDGALDVLHFQSEVIESDWTLAFDCCSSMKVSRLTWI